LLGEDRPRPRCRAVHLVLAHGLKQLADDAKAELALEHGGPGLQHPQFPVLGAPAELVEQPRLADTRGTFEQHHPAASAPGPVQCAADRGQLVLTLDQLGRRDPPGPGRHGAVQSSLTGCGRSLVGGQQPAVHGQQLASRDGAEFVAESETDLLVGLQRLGEVAAGAQRLDQRHPGRLAKWRRGDPSARELLRQRQVKRASRAGGDLQRLHAHALDGVPGLAEPLGVVTG
jgi:hypothetical protein